MSRSPIYSGWVTVASIVNIAAAGVSCGWGDESFLFTEAEWAAVMIVVAGVVNLAVSDFPVHFFHFPSVFSPL